ncbi:hypothetical protein, partial [Phocaeicola coprocola]|uniref:hypothetical protein n=1 Tax=Phocaeicola coprocola TaxID=310298 RepID=UPI003A8FE431
MIYCTARVNVFPEPAGICLDSSGTGVAGGAHDTSCFWAWRSVGTIAADYRAVDGSSADRWE